MEALVSELQQESFQQQFTNDVLYGLSQPQKQLPSKYFYDSKGSQLFDQICDLKEYYPYRTELSMLPDISNEINELLLEKHDVVEFGAGSLVKIRLLLNGCEQIRSYIPIDISSDHLGKACQLLQKDFKGLPIHPVVADFTEEVSITNGNDAPKLGFFPGSTIGNFSPQDAIQFLSNAKLSLGAGAHLLIGVDTKKDPAVLHQAYNDDMGITAAFNQNILQRINQEIEGNFDLDEFHHYAFYNAKMGRIEMHLVSRSDQNVSIGEHEFSIAEGESIHTENSHKYTSHEFEQLAAKAGWKLSKTWMDEKQFFSVYLLESVTF